MPVRCLDCSKHSEGCFGALFGFFHAFFTFSTGKSVVIKDWRLGIIFRLLQLAIFFYILFNVVNEGSYMIQEVPKGVVSPVIEVSRKERRANLKTQLDQYDNNTLPYCKKKGEAYEYDYRDVHYGKYQCLVMDVLEHPQQGETKFFLTTYMRIDKLYFVDVPKSQDSCPDAAGVDEIRDDAKKIGVNIVGVCLFNTVDQYFAIHPEDIPLAFQHSFYTSVVDKTGVLPLTVIKAKGFDGGDVWAAEDEPARLTMARLLKISGVDLDKRLDEQPNSQGLEPSARDNDTVVYPYARLSGVTLLMEFKYYTRALAPEPYNRASGRRSKDTICVVEVSPQFSWSSEGSDMHRLMNDGDDPFFIDPERKRRRNGKNVLEGIQVDFQRNGIELRFQIAGNMGHFDFFSLVNALVAGAVLLGIAQLVVSYIAVHALGLSSVLYAEHMEESVNWRMDYARFAVQSLVAGLAFRKYDADGSGTLDRKEIYKHLTSIFQGERENGQILSLDEVACLADFFLRHRQLTDGEGEREEQSEGSSDNVEITTVNMADWIDTFTEEKVQISSLTRLVKSEYSDPKTIEILHALAQGRSLRADPQVTIDQLSKSQGSDTAFDK